MTLIPFARPASKAAAPAQAEPVDAESLFAGLEAMGQFSVAARLPLDQPMMGLAELLIEAANAGWKPTTLSVSDDGAAIVLGLAVTARVIDGGKSTEPLLSHTRSGAGFGGQGVPDSAAETSSAPAAHVTLEPIA